MVVLPSKARQLAQRQHFIVSTSVMSESDSQNAGKRFIYRSAGRPAAGNRHRLQACCVGLVIDFDLSSNFHNDAGIV